MRRLQDLLKRFRRDESGSFLVIFALLAIVLIATSGAVVDFTYTQTARSRAQTALDAAALALQPQANAVAAGTITKAAAEADVKSKAQSILRERLNDSSITATVDSATIDTTTTKLDLIASITVPTAFVQLVGIRNITARLASQVTPGSKDIEVSVALDTTGSMSGSKIADLKTATNKLIDLVVKTQQTPTYSKMAIIPWSVAVNMALATTNYDTGKTVANVRGTPIAAVTITGATWMKTTTVSVNSITKANPGVLTTSANHGLATGDIVYISGVNGMTQLGAGIYKATKISNTTLSLQKWNGSSWVNVNTSTYSTYSTSPSKAKITGCLNASCQVVVSTSPNNHGLVTNDNVYISGVGGMTALNNSKTVNASTVHPVGATTLTTFVVTDEDASTVAYNAYTSGGTAQCVKYGCASYYFASLTRDKFGNPSGSPSSGYTIWDANTCVTERTGTYAFTDQPPVSSDATPIYAYLGINYTSGAAACLGQKPQPLTSSITTLKAVVTSLSASGSTAGHLGLAWGWYMISPNFGYLWPAASRPAAYGRNNLVKAVVLMTDGLFNIQYCNGVVTPEDPANGNNPSGTTTYSACSPPPNGYSKAQAIALCNAIKATSNHVTLYTVGFDLGTDQDSLDFLQGCATSPSKFFRADTGADLTDSFKKIAEDLNNLRISH